MNSNSSGFPKELQFTQNRHGDCYIDFLLGDIFTHVSAESEYKKRFGEDIFNENTLYVVIGTDSGLLPRYVISKDLPKGSRYLFVELEEIIPYVDRDIIPQNLSDRVVITGKDSWASTVRNMTLSNYAYSGMISIVRSVASRLSRHAGYPLLVDDITKEMNHIFWLFSSQFDEHVFIRTELANIAENRIPAINLRDSFAGKCAIILAAGPSLDNMIPWIKKHRNEAVLISVSRISNRLLQIDVHPDFVYSIDPQYVSFSVSKEMFGFNDKTVFINGSNASPTLVGQWPNRTLFAGTRTAWDENGVENISVIAPTVTNNAIMFAMALGCKEIILAGVDLCYSPEGYTHARGTKEYDAGPLIGKRENIIKTNDGGEAETNKEYYEAIKTLENQANGAASEGCRIINPSGSAAKIKGIEYIKLGDITISSKLDEPAWDTITKYIDNDSDEDRHEHYVKMISILEKALFDLKKIRKLSKEAITCNNMIEKSRNSHEFSKHKKRMDKIEEILSKKYTGLSNTIKKYGSPEFAKIISASTAEDLTFDDMIQKTEKYYSTFVDVSEILEDLIGSCISRLHSRCEEVSPTPNIEAMINQWQEDLQPGRGSIWMRRHKDAHLSDSDIEKLMIVEEQYKEFMLNEDKNLVDHFANIVNDSNTIGRIISGAITSLEKRDERSLSRLLNGLDIMKTPLAKQAAKLVDGFYREIKGEYSDAYLLYNSIDSKESPEMRQIGQERILTNSMDCGDYKTALIVLSDISKTIVSYKPLYARLLAITGNPIEAIDAYTDYLRDHPYDFDSMSSAGILMAEVGAIEAANNALEHIIEHAPRHCGAEELRNVISNRLKADG